MISVIIPTLNEESTIHKVIRKVKKSSHVNEIIVVDDKSIDQTVNIAIAEGAKVITSTKIGKGASMRDGLLMAQNPIIAYLDADIPDYVDNIINILCDPILHNEADIVKSSFSRQAGRVTELVAKPLLSILFPKLSKFSQPLSGIIAGKKTFFEKIDFENDYGVDIGILIDLHHLNARIKEVSIGSLSNKMKPWQELGKMSKEVSKAILKRTKKIQTRSLELLDINIIHQQMDFAINESVNDLKKMIIFDMDNTILQGSFINQIARKFNLTENLVEIALANYNPFVRIKRIGELLKGISIADIIKTLEEIPIVEDFESVVNYLKTKGFIIGIISESYFCITNHLKNKFRLDFSLANELEFSKSLCTGEVKIPSFFVHNKLSPCKHEYCKVNALSALSRKFNIHPKNIVAIGDGENDLCLIKQAGIGISFCSTHPLLDPIADFSLKDKSFKPLLNYF